MGCAPSTFQPDSVIESRCFSQKENSNFTSSTPNDEVSLSSSVQDEIKSFLNDNNLPSSIENNTRN